MLNRFGTVVLVPGRNGTTDDVRALLRQRDVTFVEASATSAARYVGLQLPALIVAGTPYEGVAEIQGALNYYLRF